MNTWPKKRQPWDIKRRPHAVPAAPAGLDACRVRRHGTRNPVLKVAVAAAAD